MEDYRPSSFFSFVQGIPPFSFRAFFAASMSILSSISSRSFRSSTGTRTATSFPRRRRTIRSPLYATRFKASENSSRALLGSIRVIVVASPDGIIRTIRTYWQYIGHRPHGQSLATPLPAQGGFGPTRALPMRSQFVILEKWVARATAGLYDYRGDIFRYLMANRHQMRLKPPLTLFRVASFFLFSKRQRLSPRAGQLISSQAGGGPHGPSGGE